MNKCKTFWQSVAIVGLVSFVAPLTIAKPGLCSLKDGNTRKMISLSLESKGDSPRVKLKFWEAGENPTGKIPRAKVYADLKCEVLDHASAELAYRCSGFSRKGTPQFFIIAPAANGYTIKLNREQGMNDPKNNRAQKIAGDSHQRFSGAQRQTQRQTKKAETSLTAETLGSGFNCNFNGVLPEADAVTESDEDPNFRAENDRYAHRSEIEAGITIEGYEDPDAEAYGANENQSNGDGQSRDELSVDEMPTREILVRIRGQIEALEARGGSNNHRRLRDGDPTFRRSGDRRLERDDSNRRRRVDSRDGEEILFESYDGRQVQ
jgi:hypothetical protein